MECHEHMNNKSGSEISSLLALTDRGQQWLNQIEVTDRTLARTFLSMLTLVSHTEYERAIERLVLQGMSEVDGPIALFAVRELSHSLESYFDVANGRENSKHTDALDRGADI